MFYDNFDKYCKMLGKSNSQVTKDIGLDPSSCSGWKKGAVPRNGTVQKLADYFGITIDELLTEDEKKEPAGQGGLDEKITDQQIENIVNLLNNASKAERDAVETLLTSNLNRQA